jgi:hypothetical protein
LFHDAKAVSAVGKTKEILEDVRRQLAPTNDILEEARARRGRVLEAAKAHGGVRDTYNSGSIAHGTANLDLDADCGVVLDRRRYPNLRPDGDGEGSKEIVSEFRELVAAKLQEEDERVEVRVTKRRAIRSKFNNKVDGFDPSVDLVVALERRDKSGVWIPNLPEDGWDPAHPAEHTRLFGSGSKKLVRVRARAIRLGKGWNQQYERPGLSSFNIEALAWECVEESMNEGEALHEIFAYGSKELVGHDTDDPARVSGPIRLLIDRDEVVKRLEKAAGLMQRALDADGVDDDEAQEALSELFWKYVDPPAGSSNKAAFAVRLRSGEGVRVGATGLTLGSGAELKRTRSYGDAEAE